MTHLRGTAARSTLRPSINESTDRDVGLSQTRNFTSFLLFPSSASISMLTSSEVRSNFGSGKLASRWSSEHLLLEKKSVKERNRRPWTQQQCGSNARDGCLDRDELHCLDAERMDHMLLKKISVLLQVSRPSRPSSMGHRLRCQQERATTFRQHYPNYCTQLSPRSNGPTFENEFCWRSESAETQLQHSRDSIEGSR